MANISFGGLASGIDTNKIIEQLVKLERRPIDILQSQVDTADRSKSAVLTLSGKFSALRTAAKGLASEAGVLVRKASSSVETVLTAAAGAGAERGAVTITVEALAHGSVAGSTVGLASAGSAVATGTGTFSFQVGTGDVKTVNVSGSTTLQELATQINGLGAGVTASAVNLGTASAPDFRLQLVSQSTGASSTITIVQDDTSLAVQTTQSGQNARFSVSGFIGTFEREANTVADVLTGVTLSLKTTGTSTITVDDDTDAIIGKVKSFVDAYNEIVAFVANESNVEQTDSKEALKIGSLANDTTVKRLVDRVHETLSGAVQVSATERRNLSSLGIGTVATTTTGLALGSLQLDEGKLRDALNADPKLVATVFAGIGGLGDGDANGVARRVDRLIADALGAGGALTSRTKALDDQLDSLQDQIEVAERRVAAVEANLVQQFAALETLVSGLQSQGSFLANALG